MSYNSRICASIPVFTLDKRKIIENYNLIKRLDIKYVELRFDYLKDISELTYLKLNEVRSIFESDFVTIFTFRSQMENGRSKIKEKDRVDLLTSIIKARPSYLDLEMKSDKFIIKKITKYAFKNDVKLILSHHNFSHTPETKEALRLILKANKMLEDWFDIEAIQRNCVFKLIFTANKFSDNIIPLDLCRKMKRTQRRTISFCMGDIGIFSRIICLLSGSFLTYASLSEKTAKGQLNIERMKEIYELIDA